MTVDEAAGIQPPEAGVFSIESFSPKADLVSV